MFKRIKAKLASWKSKDRAARNAKQFMNKMSETTYWHPVSMSRKILEEAHAKCPSGVTLLGTLNKEPIRPIHYVLVIESAELLERVDDWPSEFAALLWAELSKNHPDATRLEINEIKVSEIIYDEQSGSPRLFIDYFVTDKSLSYENATFQQTEPATKKQTRADTLNVLYRLSLSNEETQYLSNVFGNPESKRIPHTLVLKLANALTQNDLREALVNEYRRRQDEGGAMEPSER